VNRENKHLLFLSTKKKTNKEYLVHIVIVDDNNKLVDFVAMAVDSKFAEEYNMIVVVVQWGNNKDMVHNLGISVVVVVEEETDWLENLVS